MTSKKIDWNAHGLLCNHGYFNKQKGMGMKGYVVVSVEIEKLPKVSKSLIVALVLVASPLAYWLHGG